jgi:hypothetical protein
MVKIIVLFFLFYFLMKLIRTFLKVNFYRISREAPFSPHQRPSEIDITDKVRVIPTEREKNDRDTP